ncbi:MAG TPA: hypothetical protein VGF56_05925 [Rhizomicrobium sp.]|jgi:hypothetical protein
MADMTFAEFRATKEAVDDPAILNDRLGQDLYTGPCLVYLGVLAIEMETPEWKDATPALDRFQLVIGNVCTMDRDLEKLERELYAWAIEEGFACFAA